MRSHPLLLIAVTYLSAAQLLQAKEAPGVSLDPAQASAVGQKIWDNECGGTLDGLTSWNKGEHFASLGIGHFIWYPTGKSGPYQESFPELVRYLKSEGTDIPRWVSEAKGCPWPDRASFLKASHGSKMKTLRTFLKNTVPQQTAFIIRRLEAALPKMLSAAPRARRTHVRRNFHGLQQTASGTYALIDYVNFKGEGTSPKERYRGQGWGLLQVLLEMRETPGGQAAAREFAAASASVLERRVRNAPRDESRWLKGWQNRCATYGRPFRLR